MASSSSWVSLLVFVFSFAVLSIRSTYAANCTSQTFSKNRSFALCSDLPHLNATLHWTFNATNSSMDLAFVAPPAKSDGWISWAINPTSKGMIGSQALIAFRQSNGSMAVHTYNISAYAVSEPSAIAYHVWAAEGEHSAGAMRIFASLALPQKTTSVNQVWQVGSAVSGTVPAKHAFAVENLSAKGTLNLTSGGSSGGGAPAPAPAPSGGAAAPAPSGGGTAAGGGGSKSSVSSLFSHSLPISLSTAIGVIAFSLSFSHRV